MASSNRSKTTPVPPELQPYYDGNKRSGRLAWILRLVALFIIIVLIVLGVLWLLNRHHTSKPTSTKPLSGSHAQSKQPATPKTTNATPPTTNASPAPSSSSEAASGSASQPAAIPNTGPGDTVGLFLLTVVLGAGAYQVLLRRKLAQA